MQYRVLSLAVAIFALTLFAAVATAADEKGDTHEGKVVMAGNGRLTMTDRDGKNEHTHEVAQDAKISCDGKECRLEDLTEGYQVKVTTEKRGGKEFATRLEAKQSA